MKSFLFAAALVILTPLEAFAEEPGGTSLLQAPPKKNANAAWAGGDDSTRLQPLNRDVNIFFVHVAKCAGGSVIRNIGGIVHESPGTGTFATSETCMPFIERTKNRGEEANEWQFVTFLRSPRAHAVSQFFFQRHHGNFCHLNEMESGRMKEMCCGNFPANEGDEAALSLWLQFYSSDKWAPEPAPRGHYNVSTPFKPLDVGNYLGSCYTPWNMMSRALTCSTYLSHRASSWAEATPDIETVRANLERFAFVGIVELYAESICMFQYRLTQTLPRDCTCEHPEVLYEGPWRTNAQFRHESGGASLELNLPSASAAMIDRLTEVDVQLYRAAVVQFARDMVDMEARSGKRVICASRFQALRDAVLYIPGLWEEVHEIVLVYLA